MERKFPCDGNAIPEEVLVIIWSYCDAPEIFSSELVCTSWRASIRSHHVEVWFKLVQRLWDSIPNRPFEYDLTKRIQNLRLQALKKAIRGIDLTRCIEKSDFQQMLIAKLLFNKIMQRELAGEDPRFKGRYLTQYYPEWALKLAPTKASYVFAKREVERTEIIPHELCSIEWVFEFKKSAMRPEDAAMHADQRWRAVFFLNGELRSEMMPQHIYHWRVSRTFAVAVAVVAVVAVVSFHSIHSIHFSLLLTLYSCCIFIINKLFEDDKTKKHYVQVDSYPSHVVSICPETHLWRIENDFVIFRQLKPIEPSLLSADCF